MALRWGRKKRDELGSEKLHERGLLGLPMQSLHASLERWGGYVFGVRVGGAMAVITDAFHPLFAHLLLWRR